jgi:hypothetical protein
LLIFNGAKRQFDLRRVFKESIAHTGENIWTLLSFAWVCVSLINDCSVIFRGQELTFGGVKTIRISKTQEIDLAGASTFICTSN